MMELLKDDERLSRMGLKRLLGSERLARQDSGGKGIGSHWE